MILGCELCIENFWRGRAKTEKEDYTEESYDGADETQVAQVNAP